MSIFNAYGKRKDIVRDMAENLGDRIAEPNRKVNLLDIFAERIAEQEEREAIRQARLVKSGIIYENIIHDKKELPTFTVDKDHVYKKLSTLHDMKPIYFPEYSISEDGVFISKHDPDLQGKKDLQKFVHNYLHRKEFRGYTRMVVWVRAPKSKRILRVEIKKRGS